MFSAASEPVKFERDCEAVIIPSGERVQLPVGTIGYITQSLGGSFTVFVEGNLFRIAGEDGDALGKDPVPPPALPEDASDHDVEELVWKQLRSCYDPEIPINIVELGLIYRCELRRRDDGQREVDVEMTLTAPGCGMGDVLVEDVRSKLEIIPTIEKANVEMVFDPPWSWDMMSEEARLQVGMPM